MNVRFECDDPDVTINVLVFWVQARSGRSVAVSYVQQSDRWVVRGGVDHKGTTDFQTHFEGFRTGLDAATELAVQLSKALPAVERAHEDVRSAQEAVRRTSLAIGELMDGS